VQRNPLRSALPRLPDHLAKACFRVLEPPSPSPGRRSRRWFFPDRHVASLSSHGD
jgi:hypothetical protein